MARTAAYERTKEMTEEIKKIIDTYEEKGDFTYTTITNDQIEEAQKALGVKIPEQYLDFLRTYGHGGIGGIEIIGIGKSGKMLFLDETLKYREYGLDEKLILIENCDEWVYCIDCKNNRIVSWSRDDMQDAYADFDSYLLDRFTDAAENL
jgi:hypothetical protein